MWTKLWCNGCCAGWPRSSFSYEEGWQLRAQSWVPRHVKDCTPGTVSWQKRNILPKGQPESNEWLMEVYKHLSLLPHFGVTTGSRTPCGIGRGSCCVCSAAQLLSVPKHAPFSAWQMLRLRASSSKPSTSKCLFQSLVPRESDLWYLVLWVIQEDRLQSGVLELDYLLPDWHWGPPHCWYVEHWSSWEHGSREVTSLWLVVNWEGLCVEENRWFGPCNKSLVSMGKVVILGTMESKECSNRCFGDRQGKAKGV